MHWWFFYQHLQDISCTFQGYLFCGLKTWVKLVYDLTECVNTELKNIEQSATVLTHLTPIFHFYIPLKRWKTRGFVHSSQILFKRYFRTICGEGKGNVLKRFYNKLKYFQNISFSSIFVVDTQIQSSIQKDITIYQKNF